MEIMEKHELILSSAALVQDSGAWFLEHTILEQSSMYNDYISDILEHGSM